MSEPRDPPRWLEDHELASELRHQLHNYVAEAPSLERQSRMFAGLEHELGLSTGTGAAGLASRAASVSKLKLLFAAMTLLAGAIGLFALWPRPARELPSKPIATAPAAVQAPTPMPTQHLELPFEPDVVPEQALRVRVPSRAPRLLRADAVAPRPHGNARRVQREPTAVVSVANQPTALGLPVEDTTARNTRSDPVAELALLAQARRALLTHPARALEFTEQHARDYPQGTFGEEREVLAIESLYRIGLTDEAKQRAVAFERQFPNSAQRAHLTRMMQTLAP